MGLFIDDFYITFTILRVRVQDKFCLHKMTEKHLTILKRTHLNIQSSHQETDRGIITQHNENSWPICESSEKLHVSHPLVRKRFT